ncbi:MAG TPA: hypothetical protein VKF84_02815 [Candidatus Sulfotelmatobacter sp.]|nr:hypothetical protein [Candidatus Sulfotelmatobacter sp.]
MKTRTLVMVSAAVEAATGVALIAVPDLVARLLLGTGLTGSGVAVARVAGFGLLSLAIACWPGGDDISPHATRALFLYNLLAGLYLGFLRVGGEFAGYLLWPACVVHVLLAFLLARPAYKPV